MSLADRLDAVALAARDAWAWSPRARLPGPTTRAAAAARAVDPDAAMRAISALDERYPLEPLLAACGAAELAESLAALELLDQVDEVALVVEG